MAKVLVSGSTGLLGSVLVPLLQERGHEVISLGHTQATDINVNLVSYEQTAQALDKVQPEVIINLAALTNVDRCETHPQDAYLLNVKPVENLKSWINAASHPCHLIQISSDQVYDGSGPHTESQLTIRNQYAMSKLAGEFAAMNVPSTILRTNFFGRSLRKGRGSFTDWLYSGLLGTTSVNVFNDVLFSPLAMATLCDCIERIVVELPIGVFNLGSCGGMSKADFAFAFAAATKLPTSNLVRCNSTSTAALAACRPTDMRMNCGQFEVRMRLKLPRLIDEIQLVARDYK